MICARMDLCEDPPRTFYPVLLVLCYICSYRGSKLSKVARMTTAKKLVDRCSHLKHTAVCKRQPVETI